MARHQDACPRHDAQVGLKGRPRRGRVRPDLHAERLADVPHGAHQLITVHDLQVHRHISLSIARHSWSGSCADLQHDGTPVGCMLLKAAVRLRRSATDGNPGVTLAGASAGGAERRASSPSAARKTVMVLGSCACSGGCMPCDVKASLRRRCPRSGLAKPLLPSPLAYLCCMTRLCSDLHLNIRAPSQMSTHDASFVNWHLC